MNEEMRGLLEDLFIGAIINGEEAQGISFTQYNDGAVMLNIRCASDHWHSMLVPSENIKLVQDRLGSVPSVAVAATAIVDTSVVVDCRF